MAAVVQLRSPWQAIADMVVTELIISPVWRRKKRSCGLFVGTECANLALLLKHYDGAPAPLPAVM